MRLVHIEPVVCLHAISLEEELRNAPVLATSWVGLLERPTRDERSQNGSEAKNWQVSFTLDGSVHPSYRGYRFDRGDGHLMSDNGYRGHSRSRGRWHYGVTSVNIHS